MITLTRGSCPETQENTPYALSVAIHTPSSPVLEPNDADIVPNPIQDRLMYWRDIFRIGQFDIGDLTAEVILLNAQNGMQITHKRIFKAVSTFCGKTPRTVRYYYETAVFYDNEVRQQYNVLPFSHFVEARVFGDQWKSYLETAMLYPHKGTEFIRYLMVSQSSTLLPVAVGVAVGVAAGNGAGENGLGNPGYEPGGSEKNNGEVSQDKPGNPVNIHAPTSGAAGAKQSCEVSQDYPAHEAIGRVDALMTAIQDCLPVIDQAELPENVKSVLLVASSDMLHYLPKVGEYFSHPVGVV